MRAANDTLRIVAHEEPQSGLRQPARGLEAGLGSEGLSTHLIELLNEIDGVKREIQERARHKDVVKQARAVLVEDANRSDTLKTKLAEIEDALHAAHRAMLETEAQPETARLDCGPGRPESRSEDSPPFDGSPAQCQPAAEAANTPGASAKRSEDAESSWKRADLAAQEARRLWEESALRLNQARTREEAAFVEIHSSRLELMTTHQSVSKQFDLAEASWKQANEAIAEVRQTLEKSTADLLQARDDAEAARADLRSAQQELMTAYQFAAVAAQKRHEAAEYFKTAMRWLVFASAILVLALVWITWLVMRAALPVWAPCAASMIVICAALLLVKRFKREE